MGIRAGMTENWYLILELEFAPNPVKDEALIDRRIEEKRKFWSGKANDFNHGPEYRKYSQMLNDIRRDMIGETNIRDALINDACEKTYGPIDKILKQIRKTELPEDTVDKIAEKQKVDSKIVKCRAEALGIRVVESHAEDLSALYEKCYKTKPLNFDKFNGMKQMLQSFRVGNLYEFLCLGTTIKNAGNLPCDALRQRSGEKRKKEFYKNDSISGTGSKLCGYCEDAFKDEASKQIYDQYIQYNRRKTILDGVKELYDMTGELSAEAYKDYVSQLTELSRNRKDAESILKAFLMIEKLPIPAAGGSTAASSAKVKICRCGCTNDVSDGRKICKSCGMDLQIRCPKCKAVSDADIFVCKCGFRFENIDKATALCGLASDLLDHMEFNAARTRLADALKYWPGSELVRTVQARLTELESRVGSVAAELKKACAGKNYYEAEKQYGNIKKFFPEYSDSVVEEEIRAAIEAAGAYKKEAQAGKKEAEIVEACVNAYEACNDCPGIKEILAKYPPMEPSDLRVSADGKARVNVLSWTKSSTEGLLYYSVVRKAGAVPISVQDGKLVGRVSMCSINDQEIMPGTGYCYAVFAERAGILSKGLYLDEPVSNLFEVSSVTVTAGDMALQLAWDKIADHAEVEIERFINGSGTKLVCSNRSGFTDKNLTNDCLYEYRVYLAYRIGTQRIMTEGVMVSGTPIRPSKPVERLTVRPLENGEFQIDWVNPECREVHFFYSKEKPEFGYGDLVPMSVIESCMKSLMVKKVSDLSGLFRYSEDNLIYIMAVTEKSGTAVAGAIVRASRGSQVKITSVTQVNGKILIRTDLPKGATGFVVLYRNDQFPEDIGDVRTVRKYIPLKQYAYDSGLFIDECEPKNYYISVFAEFKREGEKDYSSGSDYLYCNVLKEEITYSVVVNRKIFGSSMLHLTFTAGTRDFILPDIDIMSCVGTAPMFKKSAKLFYQITGLSVAGEYEVKIPLEKGMAKDTYIKAFLKDENLQKSYQMKLKLKSELKIS